MTRRGEEVWIASNVVADLNGDSQQPSPGDGAIPGC